jgi:polysaccharide export outer membrane protein
MAAIVAAGGLMSDAATEVEIRRRGGPGPANLRMAGMARTEPASYQETESPPAVARVDLISAAREAKGSFTLGDGDVVYVAKRTLKPIYVLGLVRKPGEYPLPTNQDLRLLDALALAGGVSNPVADNLLIIRQVPGQSEPVKVTATVQGAKTGRDNLVLAPGDTVSVEQTAATVVVDAVQTFFRVGFTAAMPGF